MINSIRKLGYKKLAVCFLTIFVAELFSSPVALALTSGPTTPETSSFEPVDTTDMVNLQTGDFTYNVPLLEVPGPEGGYPLSLSYHAGILPGEDASWVGLGWTLNPGALNRSVNGYPDDWKNQVQVARDYWEGGTSTNYSVGVSVGLSGPVGNVGVGLDFSNDTYRGFGVGYSVSGVLAPQGSPLGLQMRLGVSPYGDAYANVGVGLSVGSRVTENMSVGANLNAGMEISNAGISSGFSAGVGVGAGHTKSGRTLGGSLLGATISSGGNKPSLSLGGLASTVHNSNAGNISTKSNGFSFGIPIWYGINLQLGYSKQRYWSDESMGKFVSGSLDPSIMETYLYVRSFDSYSLLDETSGKSIVDEPDPRRTLGGSYMDFDLYSVNAQGLGGNIRPYFFRGYVQSQNIHKNGKRYTTYDVSATDAPYNNDKPFFRFVNDFSNSFRQNEESVPLDPNPIYGNNDSNTGYGGGNKLAGSKHIEYYTLDNVPIKPRNAKGYNTSWVKGIEVNGNSAASTVRSGLTGGFSITNESGVTYHFSLPAYSYKEESYQERIPQDKGFAFNRQTKTEPYAYTWHLTAITGPDYRDRAPFGIVDENDWGYWVSFEYGRFSDRYVWRNPDIGFHQDEDNEFKGMSIGTKEVYYLNAIRTRSHIALFEKDIRLDGKSVSSDSYTKRSNQGSNAGSYGTNSVHSLKLNKIYLLNASDSSAVLSNSANSTTSSTCSNCEFLQHVIDRNDIDIVGRVNIEEKAVRIIDFHQDYSLAANTTNSFDGMSPNSKYGKLTLNGYEMRGKGGARLLPLTEFEYDFTDQEAPLHNVTFKSGSVFTSYEKIFNKGDMLYSADKRFAGVIESVTEENPVPSDPLGRAFYSFKIKNSTISHSNGQNISLRKTKNPPYAQSHKDHWGYYKSDYSSQEVEENYNMGKQTTSVSASGTDAWSLRKIKNAIGNSIKIEYESDTYEKAVFSEDISLIMNNPIKIDDYTVEFTVNGSIIDILDQIPIGSKYRGILHYQLDRKIFPGTITEMTVNERYNILINQLEILQKNGNVIRARSSSIIKPDPEGIASTFKLVTGNMVFKNPIQTNYGGGVRVVAIENASTIGEITRTTYSFAKFNSAVSSGTTSYLPTILPSLDNTKLRDGFTRKAKDSYRKWLYQGFEKLYILARELPPPAVMYENVTVSSSVLNGDMTMRSYSGKTEYTFDVLRANMVGRKLVKNEILTNTDATSVGGKGYRRMQSMKRFLSSIGNLMTVRSYGENNKLLNEVTNHYLHDGLNNQPFEGFMSQYESRLASYNFQGLLKERVVESKRLYPKDNENTFDRYVVFNGKEEYPCIQTGTTVRDLISGVTTVTRNLSFDFYNGSVTGVLTEDGYGNRFLTETMPAYRVYPKMGLKINTSGNANANMLSQIAGTVVYKVNESNSKVAVVNATAQAWSNKIPVLLSDGSTILQDNGSWNGTGDVWRMSDSYSWLQSIRTSDGLTPITQFNAFIWDNPSTSHANWQRTGAITLYDAYSKPLEGIDINGNYSATRMGTKSSKVYVTGGSAKYTELAFSGAEDETVSSNNPLEVQRSGATVTSDAAHSGTKSLLLGTNQRGFQYTVPISKLTVGRAYSASVWVKAGTSSDTRLYYQANGGPVVSSISSSQSTKKSGDWTLLTLNIKAQDIDGSGNLAVYVQNNASGIVYVDDFRFQPVDASSTAYVYDNFSGELTYVLDNNNLFTKYEYDQMGRLKATYMEKMGMGAFKTSEYLYNYGKPIPVEADNYTVYARVEIENYSYYNNTYPPYNEGSSGTKADIYIRFYWDISCTSPAQLPSSLPLTYENSYTSQDQYGSWGGQSSINIIASQGVNSVLVEPQIIVYEQYSYWENHTIGLGTEVYNYDYRLLSRNSSGPGYYTPLATKY
ncbi:hypothetical protein FAZ19_05795 [Sphingobacterium alkalisoli]|uniref:CBM-cenC domain-containing protein n=1 Tax=Sphingobacterium alkalisoli TaxID=1874115 RepID=A0A4U0H5E9_9SPHI|nr:hypothetical protein [Sphingobacterium alkalisoli]TJY66434.1 hypothetical protein FAZ19_05795 [Sphingobacterium alkalisoli]GGH16433.1 hypothetical protein GCM10011418_18800 [Sphingobacterium alkalisoli]